MAIKEKKITIVKKLRPIRLAFLVTKEDKRTLSEVFCINTCLWGGIYNPIIPFFKQTPKNWGDRRFRHPIKVFCPKSSKEIALLSACCFGDVPNVKEMDYIKKNYSHCCNPQDLTINQSNFLDCLLNEGASPLRITRAELQVSSRGWRADSSMFFMDATSWLDIVDYWNLRAVGRDVLPLPKQYSDNYIDLINKIIKRNFVPYRHNKNMMHNTNFICSRSSTMKEMETFSRKLTTPGQGAISLQHWYPRMWDEWAKDKDLVELCSVVAKEESKEISLEDRYVSFKDISPEFAEKYRGNGKPRWINIIRFKDFYKRYDCPSVLPRNLKDAYLVFGAHSFVKCGFQTKELISPVSITSGAFSLHYLQIL